MQAQEQPATTTSPEIMTLRQAQAYAQVSKSTLQRWERRG